MVRSIDPTNRRCKLVSLTDAGRDVVAAIDAVDDPAPEVVAALSDAELKQLHSDSGAHIGAERGLARRSRFQHRHRGVVTADP